MNMGTPAMPSMGSLSMPTSQFSGGIGQSQPASDGISISDSFTGIIDAAAPRNVIFMRLDLNYNNPQPSRAEYIFAKGGLPGSNGLPKIETKVDYQDWTSYGE